MNSSHGQFGNTNFLMKYNFHDIYPEKQRNPERIGDVGEVSENYVKAARDQFHNKPFNDLAADPTQFITPDHMDGTDGREDNKNYKRMEYDAVERDDDKAHSDVIDQVMKSMEWTAKKVNSTGKQKKVDWTINTLDYAVGDKPITASEYEDQD